MQYSPSRMFFNIKKAPKRMLSMMSDKLIKAKIMNLLVVLQSTHSRIFFKPTVKFHSLIMLCNNLSLYAILNLTSGLIK